ncbi:MAG: DNA repair protein RecO [Desulfitobacteriaceae bacterium]|nr:DNA repair protein RecO [Desulfitobacteriaceae bacterium]MDD4346606.1 DNA repair protein RecO [Desulfitobacteriaceae bacterium]MDD4401871.1 DNA repair protein RecO [Desulfitobacteriaceae bacterium]
MAVYHADAIVIRSREYAEADRILTIFSREHGKLQVIAKGVRKPKSRQRGGTQLFTYADFLLYQGRNLDTVSQVSPKESFAHLWDDLERTMAATGMAELLDLAVLTGQPQPELFSLTLTFLFLLANYDPLLILSAYALRLLTILGFSPVLEECAECGGRVKGESLYFSPPAGGIVCDLCLENFPGRRLKAGSIAFMNRLLKNELAKLDRLRWPVWMQQEVRETIQSYCEQKLERPLRAWSIGKTLGI